MIVPTYETTAREQEIIINELRSINRTQENRISIQKEEIKRLNDNILTLENEIKAKTELLKQYDEFITDLAKSIKQSPSILLKGKVVKSEFERVPYSLGNRLYVVWEFEDKDLDKID